VDFAMPASMVFSVLPPMHWATATVFRGVHSAGLLVVLPSVMAAFRALRLRRGDSSDEGHKEHRADEQRGLNILKVMHGGPPSNWVLVALFR
jgi:hypothetical protein